IVENMAGRPALGADLWLARALHVSCVGRLDEAIGCARRFHDLDPLNDESVVWLGACLLRRGQLDEAREGFERRMATSEDSDVFNLIIIYAFQREWTRAHALIASERFTRLPVHEREPVLKLVAALRAPECAVALRNDVRTEVESTGATDFRSLSLLAHFGF